MPTRTAQVQIPKSGLPAPEAVNFFHFTFSGPEVQLLVGFVDLNHLIEVGRGATSQVRPEVSHRFMMSIRGFMLLRRQIEEISEKLEKVTGAKPDLTEFNVELK